MVLPSLVTVAPQLGQLVVVVATLVVVLGSVVETPNFSIFNSMGVMC